MKKSKLLTMCLVAVTGTMLWAAPSVSHEEGIYKNDCAQCHGAKAEGVVLDRSKNKKVVKKVKGVGTYIINKANHYGPALNNMSQKEISEKLTSFRKKSDFMTHPYHSVMRENLKNIETKEGKISDDKMAAYIQKTFSAAK